MPKATVSCWRHWRGEDTMFRIEIPSLAVRDEVRLRLEADPSAIVFTESRRGVARGWGMVCFAFSVGVAMGWLWRF